VIAALSQPSLAGDSREPLTRGIIIEGVIMRRRDAGLIAAIEAVGSVGALARALGISDKAVRDWFCVPVGRVLQVEAVTGIPRKALRSDLYPANVELDEHADAIRRIDCQSFEGAVEIEIGRRLVLCRKLFKVRRAWSAWIKIEFGWSRKHADNIIGLYLNERDRRICEGGNLVHRAAAEGFVEWVAGVLPALPAPAAKIAAVLPAKHKVDEDVERVMRFLDEFRRARREARAEKLKWLRA